MAGKDERVDNAEIRNWISDQIHTADCRCKLCWTHAMEASGVARSSPGGDVERSRKRMDSSGAAQTPIRSSGRDRGPMRSQSEEREQDDDGRKLSLTDVRGANDRACKLRPPKGGAVVREPTDNVFGSYKFLRRTDGLFLVFDTRVWPTDGDLYRTEKSARDATKALAALEKSR